MRKGHKGQTPPPRREIESLRRQVRRVGQLLTDLVTRFEPVADHVAAHERLLHEHDARITQLERPLRQRRMRIGRRDR